MAHRHGCKPSMLNTPHIIVKMENHIPIIVYTSITKHDILKKFIDKPVVDFVIKSNCNNSAIVINLIAHVLYHRQTKVLIADDSAISRVEIREALDGLKPYTIEAKNYSRNRVVI